MSGTRIVKVPSKIAKQGLQTPAGAWQEEKYGKDMRVCNICGADKDRFRDTVTGEEFGKKDVVAPLGKKGK